jgi:chromate reductase
VVSDGFLIASPEYNSAFTPLLKNALDWASRTETEDEPDLLAFDGKIVALCSASPGFLGGLRSLQALRTMLTNLGVLVIPDQVTLSKAYEAFDDFGKLKDYRKAKQIAALAEKLVQTISRLNS